MHNCYTNSGIRYQANRHFFSFWVSDTLALRAERQSVRKSKTKNGRLASRASNPLVNVLVLEIWAKMAISVAHTKSEGRQCCQERV